jgi:hypothetical protein
MFFHVSVYTAPVIKWGWTNGNKPDLWDFPAESNKQYFWQRPLNRDSTDTYESMFSQFLTAFLVLLLKRGKKGRMPHAGPHTNTFYEGTPIFKFLREA